MNTLKAQTIVIGGMTAVGIVAAANTVAEGSAPAPRMAIGYAGACLGLGVIALYSPNTAASLTGLVVVATIFTQSDALWSAIIKVTGATGATRSSAKGAARTEGLSA